MQVGLVTSLMPSNLHYLHTKNIIEQGKLGNSCGQQAQQLQTTIILSFFF